MNRQITFRKRPLETGPTNGLRSLFQQCCYMSPITPEWALSGAKINIFFEITNIFQEKLHLGAKKVIREIVNSEK